MSGRPLFDEHGFRAAVQACWDERSSAAHRQETGGRARDVGLRTGVTSGRHLDSLAAVVANVFVDVGLPATSVFLRKRVELPGYFRAEKQWDLVVVHDGELVAAIELKSMLGSYGNNLNNRVEEAVGNAHDLLRAYEEGRFGSNARAPWIGFVYVVQEDAKSTSAVTPKEPHFDVDPVFDGASYVDRVVLLCRRLVVKRLYSGACVVTSDGSGPAAVREPADDLTFAKFVAGISGRVGEVLA